MEEMTEETQRILSCFPTPEEKQIGRTFFHKLVKKESYGEFTCNGMWIDEDELEQIFPDEFSKNDDDPHNEELMQQIRDAWGRFVDALPEHQMLYVEDD
jgi:hypothetical protein